jgi:hypothetical protein
MVNKLLADMDFASIISESVAQTQTGSEFLNKYKSWLMANESTCGLVNKFLAEGRQYNYDNGVMAVMEKVADFIQLNKTSWALSSVCESLKAGKSSYNFLNQPAIAQVEKLLENDEETVNKYIKAGALKNVMYVTEFRNVAKQVFHNTPMVESSADFVMVRPISLVESCGDGYLFEVAGKVIKIAADGAISEGSWNDVSNTFRVVSSLLESNICSFDESSEGLTVKYNNVEYQINEAGKLVKLTSQEEKEMTVEELRENNRLMTMAANPRFRNQVAQVLEAIALTCENFDKIAKMDNTGIYTTKSDRFLVVNEGTNMYATLLASNHIGLWTINTNVVEALETIKKNTRVSLSEKFNEQVKAVVEQTSAEDKAKIEAELKEARVQGIKERIEALREQYKDNPTMLAVLSEAAQNLQTAEE